MRAPRLSLLAAAVASAGVGAAAHAHSGPRVWVGSVNGQVATFAGGGTSYAAERVFIGGVDENTLESNGRLDEFPFAGSGFYATDFPGYQVRTDGLAGFTIGRTFGFELAGPLLVYDPAAELFATVRKQYAAPGPAPQFQLSNSIHSVTTGSAPAAGFNIFTYNGAGDHGHFVTGLLGDGANPGDGPHAVYALPLRLTGTGLERSQPYYMLLGRDRGYLAGDPGQAEFLAAEQAARQTLASHSDWPGQWWSAGGGNWSDASKWMPDVADVPTLPAQFLGRITAPATVNVDDMFSVGTLVFDSAHGYTLAAAGGWITAHPSDGANVVRVVSGSHTIAAPLAFATTASVDVAAGSMLTITSGLLGAGRTITKTGGGTLAAQSVRADGLVIAGGTVAIAPTGGGTPAGTSRVITLTVADGARLDLGDNKLIVPGASISTLTDLIRSGHNAGAWDGDGIVTSTADAAGGLTTLGIATADETGYVGGTFGGFTTSSGDVLVMYTYAGDSNLDGAITGDDYSNIDFNIAVPGASGWYKGDFNYDGIISGDDYSVIDFNIVAQGAPFPTLSAEGVLAIPEPAACGFTGLAAALLLRRRRRRRGQECC